jgi:tripartite-type tricarboxylate transporter receptor subunit TctC
MVTRRHFLSLASLSLASLAGGLPKSVLADDEITRFVVGFQAGGGMDLIARVLAAQWNTRSNKNAIVENKPGAAGRLAASLVKRAPQDGSMLLITPSPVLTLFPHTLRKIPYDPLRDFAPVTALAKFDYAFAVSSSTKITSLKQYLDLAKNNKDLQTFGSPGIGLTPDFVGMMLARAGGFKLLHVGYKGTAPALQDLMGGQISTMSATTPAMATAQKTGKIRVLATTGDQRSPELPDVPTFKELGIKDLVMEDWVGMLAPAGTPKKQVDEINRIVVASLADPKLQSQYKTQGFQPAGGTPEQTAELLKVGYDRWAEIVKTVDFKVTG